MGLAGNVRTCVILAAIALAIGLANGDKIGPLLYRMCHLDHECNFQGGMCNLTIRQCACTKGYVPSSNKQYCVQKIDSIEASCTDRNQCLPFLANSTCENGKCVCASGYHLIDNVCWEIIEIGESCKKNEECSHIEGVICNDNMTCGCPAETVLNENGTRCLAVAKKIQDECTEEIQCATTFTFSTCIDKVCQCDHGYHYEREMTRCFPNRAIGESCNSTYECYQAEDYENDSSTKSMMCDPQEELVCTCADNYVLIDNKCVSAGASVAVTLSIIVCAIALSLLS